MLEDLKRYQAGDSITARAPTIADRVVKRVRKHRTPVRVLRRSCSSSRSFSAATPSSNTASNGAIGRRNSRSISRTRRRPARTQAKWLKERFAFLDKEARAPVEPWPVRDGAMIMKQHEWCWLGNVRIRDDTKVFVELGFKGKPEAFQICINSRKKLRQWENNPPGYSCRVGIWAGSMDLVTRNEVDRRNDFSSLVVSSLPKLLVQNAGDESADARRIRKVSLTFQRQGEKVTLQVNGKDVHHETYLMPLLLESDEQGGDLGQYENIGIRTWGQNVEVRSLYAYRFKLPEKASPTVAGDALAETGHLKEAIAKYRTRGDGLREGLAGHREPRVDQGLPPRHLPERRRAAQPFPRALAPHAHAFALEFLPGQSPRRAPAKSAGSGNARALERRQTQGSARAISRHLPGQPRDAHRARMSPRRPRKRSRPRKARSCSAGPRAPRASPV